MNEADAKKNDLRTSGVRPSSPNSPFDSSNADFSLDVPHNVN